MAQLRGRGAHRVGRRLYAKLAIHHDEGGGAITFLRKINADGFAGSFSWVLIFGYVLTNAVYTFTFGQYFGHIAGLGSWFPRVAGITIVALFIWLSLRGVGEAGDVEVFLVCFKLIELVGLAFMAYEGFQLLTYDYKDIDTPKKTLPRAVLSAIVVVIVVYIFIPRTGQR